MLSTEHKYHGQRHDRPPRRWLPTRTVNLGPETCFTRRTETTTWDAPSIDSMLSARYAYQFRGDGHELCLLPNEHPRDQYPGSVCCFVVRYLFFPRAWFPSCLLELLPIHFLKTILKKRKTNRENPCARHSV